MKKKRSKIRLFFGRIYYRLRRFFYWYFSKTKFAKKQEKRNLHFLVFKHKSFLRRKLKNVDMWMQENKIKNLEIAIKNLDGLIIEPNNVFSYWRQIGSVNKSKGYLPGMILVDGKFMPGIGGGLCQLSNMIYWMVLHSPLRVIERWRHSYDVFPDLERKQPFASGATCAYPNIDLQFKNETNQKFQLRFWLDDEYLHGELRSDRPVNYKYEIIEKDHKIEANLFGAYQRKNKLYRQIIEKDSNFIVEEELVAVNDALMMYNPLLE